MYQKKNEIQNDDISLCPFSYIAKNTLKVYLKSTQTKDILKNEASQ